MIDEAPDLGAMDYDAKCKLLESIAGQMLSLRVEFARVSGRAAELRAEMTVLREVKSAIQSALKAEQAM